MDAPAGAVGPPAAHVVESEVGDQISLYDPESEEVLVLNPTASDVWRLSDGTHTLDEIAALLGRAYGVDPGAIAADVAGAVADFASRGLLAVPPAP